MAFRAATRAARKSCLLRRSRDMGLASLQEIGSSSTSSSSSMISGCSSGIGLSTSADAAAAVGEGVSFHRVAAAAAAASADLGLRGGSEGCSVAAAGRAPQPAASLALSHPVTLPPWPSHETPAVVSLARSYASAAAGRGGDGGGGGGLLLASRPQLLHQHRLQQQHQQGQNGQQRRGLMWSVEKEKGHKYKDVDAVLNAPEIERVMESTKNAAKDKTRILEILEAAKERSFLSDHSIAPKSEYVQGLNLEEMATLLNVDAHDEELMRPIFDTALAIKERIYGNRIVLFAPLYIANYCVNQCTYCAFRAPNKGIERSYLSDDAIRSEVEALERQGHRRLLVLTGEHPKYTFDQFLRAIDVIASVRTEPCGNIRRINVEIPSLSVSDMRRLKATDHVGTYTLFQETYHRPTFKTMHISGPKSDFDHRFLTMDRAMIGGLDDVGLGVLFGLYDYRFECLAMLQHANHLEREYGAGPHTISVPRMRPAVGAETSVNPPYPVDDANFLKLVAVLRIGVPYTGMILSTRESAEMRSLLLKVGMSQMSAGSRTDVGAYHRDASLTTEKELGNLAGQFSLSDHRSVSEIVEELMETGYVPSWCTACYRKGRTGEAFMKIAKAGNIHNFCHPNSLLTLQEYLNDYGSERAKEIGADVIARESEAGLSDAAKRLLDRKMKKVQAGERDVYL